MPRPIKASAKMGEAHRRASDRPWTLRHPLISAIVLLFAIAALVVLLSGLALNLPLADKGAPTAVVGIGPTQDTLASVVVGRSGDVWAVGFSGTILHYSRGQWSSLASTSTTNVLWGLAMNSPTDGWAVGNVGTILHYAGGHWTAVTSTPTSNNLNSVAMNSPTDGWAVGANGTILHYAGGHWSRVRSPTSSDLTSVAMNSPSDGWAVGNVGTILHYSTGVWSAS